ncbi:MAG: hypothetical protein V7711_13430 [Pseudomonadales bacterium]
MQDRFSQGISLIGQSMLAVSGQELWPSMASYLRPDDNSVALGLRLGSGMATYASYDPLTRQYKVTYGLGMIASKLGLRELWGWRTVREMEERNYFAGEISLANVFAHTMVHELAHVIQMKQGKRRRGSVHNAAFYRICDQIHAEGKAARARDQLLAECRSDERILSALSQLHLPQAQAGRESFEVGMLVKWGERGGQGEIKKLNPKRAVVVCQQRRGVLLQVPYTILQLV